ncbi:zinc ribbon domain-containing protein [Bifidobacterium catulorum]|uniref:Zinc-ribbon domain-containing protein n=1 Tax=Bifidobacterium catulorum TaxID=1630173 RepID=A0A2U2MT52_9BIFI|nr:zinc ribbon domain-containing protein [Bifidobacterium catulorum]PWG60018.1 hypothetical protein DF200_04440 [Bifidobacterium catulorum]
MPDKLAKPEKFCPKCGTLRSVGMRFCANCGYRFPTGAEENDGNAAEGTLIPDSPAEITVVQTGSIPPVQDAPAADGVVNVANANAGAHDANSAPVPLPNSMHGTGPLPTKQQDDDDEGATQLMAPQALPTLPLNVAGVRGEAGATPDVQQTVAMPAAGTASDANTDAVAGDAGAVSEQKTEVISPLAGNGASTQVLPPMQAGAADGASPLARLAVVSNADGGAADGNPAGPGADDGGTAAPDNGKNGGSADPNAKYVRVAVIVAIIIVTLAVIGGGWALWSKHRHTAAMEACVAAQNDFDAAKTSLDATLKKVKPTADTDESKLTDANTLTDLKDLITQGSKDSSAGDNTCSDGLSAKELDARANAIGLKTKALKTLDGKLDAAAKAVTASKNKKAFNETESSLKKAYAKAEQLVSSATGKVSDVQTLTALKQALTSAKQAMDEAGDADTASDSAITEMNTQLKALNAAMDKVNTSVKAKQAADAKKKAEEEKKKADKARCSSIAGNYGGFQFDEVLTVAADCSVTFQPNFGSSSTAKYVANSYTGSGAGASWKLSNGQTMTLYPAGTSSPVIDKLFATYYAGHESEKPQYDAKNKLESGNKAYVAG